MLWNHQCARRVSRQRSWPIVAACLAIAIAIAAFAAPSAQAGPVVIKMATLVPDGSSWHMVLEKTAEEWKKISNGQVRVRIYAGGVAGDDPDVVRKIRLGTLHAGVLTSVGVAKVDPSVYALGVPLMYAGYDEVYAVLEKLRPKLEAQLEAKGFIVLNWADGGWVHFFTQEPVARPDDLRKLKLFTWAGDNEAIEIWKSARFNPIPLPATEIATALQTGLVTALGAPPQVAVISGYYRHAPNMTDLAWQLLLGATVIDKGTWEKIPADIRPALLESARKSGENLRAEIRRSGTNDVAAMKKRGLNVVAVDAAARAEWQKLAEGLYSEIRGKVVPAEMFDEAMRVRNQLRKQQSSR